MNYQNLTALDMGIAAALILVNGALSLLLRLGLGRQLLGVHPFIVGVADRQALEFDSRFLGLGQILGDFARVIGAVAFQQRVVQRRGVFDPVVRLSVRSTQCLAIQRLGFFRQALVEV